MEIVKNFAKGVLSIGYDSSATTLVLAAGDGARFPSTAFNAVWWNSTDYPDPSDDPDVEIIRVTSLTTDTLTVTRGQEGTSAVPHNFSAKVYKLLAGLTAEMLNTLGTDLDSKAPLFSPVLVGNPTAPTASADTDNTQLSTTAFVIGQEYLKTAAAASTYAPLNSPSLTGVPTAPTADVDSNTTQLSTTAFVLGQGYLKAAAAASTYASLASPAFTGTPTAPTQGAGNNATRPATTAFVQQEITSGLASVLKLKGAIDCSTNPNYPAASAGWTYRVSGAGKIGGSSGVSASIGDLIICLADNAGGTQASVGSSWQVEGANLPGITTVGNSLLTLADPGAVTFLRINADNSVDTRTAAQVRGDIGLGSIATQAASSVAVTGGTVAGLSGLALRSSGSGAFDLSLANTENLTAARTQTQTGSFAGHAGLLSNGTI